MPIPPDLAIFVVMTMTDNRQTKPIALPLAHARGVMLGIIGASRSEPHTNHSCEEIAVCMCVCVCVCTKHYVIQMLITQLRMCQALVCMKTVGKDHQH